jgi:hypothetical protein
MGMKWCPDGEHEHKVAFRARAGERRCPIHGCDLKPLPRKTGRALGADHSAAETRARQRFNDEVRDHQCFYGEEIGVEKRRRGHVCTYPLDAHHLVEKQWIRREFGDLPEDELLAILYAPAIGAPLCRAGHEGVKRLRIHWHELSDECKLFCQEIDERYGDNHPSMFERLRRECGVGEGDQC